MYLATSPGFPEGVQPIGNHRAPIPIARVLVRYRGLGRASFRLGQALVVLALFVAVLAPAALPGERHPPLPSALSTPLARSLSSGSARTPALSTSLYLSTTDGRRLNRMGCVEGQSSARRGLLDTLVVLDFGRPARASHQEGTVLIRSGFRPVWRIRNAVLAYASGFIRCTSDHPAAHLTVAAGTSNWGPHVTYGHGQAWGRMLNDANEALRGSDRSGRITVLAADDIELNWNSPAASKRWIRGYQSVASWPYLDYGDAGSCPPFGRCAGGWSVDDVWWVTWGASRAMPLPEIYTNSGSQAQQWYRLSLYSYLRHGRRMIIAGVLSQRRACNQSLNDPCTGMNNSPSAAWKQLAGLLNRDRRTAQAIRWATDIGYDR